MAVAAPLILGSVGAAIGWTVGGSLLAAQVGWAVGSAIGATFAPTQRVEGPKLADLRVSGTDYGQPIPYLFGAVRLPGQIWWASDRRSIPHTTSSGGGKGGGGGVETTTYTYEVDILYGLTDNEAETVTRVWLNGKLVWTSLEASEETVIWLLGAGNYTTAVRDAIIAELTTALDNSATTAAWSRMTFYSGASDQLPDPTYEAAVGTADAIGYRNRASIFFESLDLGGSGQIPQLTFEVARSVQAGTPVESTRATQGNPYSSFLSAHAFAGFPATSPLTSFRIGFGNWTNTYSRPFMVTAYTYTVASDSYAADGPTFEVFPSASDGDIVSLRHIDSDVPIWAGASEKASEQRVEMYRMDVAGPTARILYWQEASVGNLLARRGDVVIVGYFLTGTQKLKRYDLSGGTAPVATNSSAHGFSTFSIHPNETYLYGANYELTAILKVDVATLAIVDSLTMPAGAIDTQIFFDASDQDSAVYAAWYGATENRIYRLVSEGSPATWELLFTDTDTVGNNWGSQVKSSQYAAMSKVGGYIFVSSMEDAAGIGNPHRAWRLGPFEINTPLAEDVQTVVEELCARTGLAAAQYDATALATITRPMRGLAVSQITTTRQAIEILMSAYFFEMTLWDKLYFIPRGGSSSVTIPYEDLGAAEDGATDFKPLEIRRTNDLEIPSQIAITYSNLANDYQLDTQFSDRAAGSEETVNAIQYPLVMIPNEAKQLADAMLWDTVIGQTGTSISVLCDYARNVPSDVITITDDDSSTYRMRILQREDAFPLIRFECVLDDASVLQSQGITSADYSPGTSVGALADTIMAVLDIPILRDADDNAGIYVSTRGSATPYPGSNVLRSVDDSVFDEIVTVTESGTLGTCSTVLGAWYGGRVFDMGNSVTVDLGLSGVLTSATRAQVIADQEVNAVAIGSDTNGWEVLQFLTATLVTTGVYTLSGLLRGCRGTEWMQARHVSGEQCVALQAAGMRRVEMTTTQLGVAYYWRGVTLGRGIDTETSQTITNNGTGLRPFSPYALRVKRDPVSGDVAITFRRRTRYATRWVGALGPSAPLGEDSEDYEVDVVAPGSPDTVVRTLTSWSTNANGETEFAYTAAQQTTDFGSPTPGTFRVRAYQLSALVGRGYAKEVTA